MLIQDQAPMVERPFLGRVGKARKHPALDSRPGVVGPEPHRRLHAGQRLGAVAQVVGWFPLGWVGVAWGHPAVGTLGRVVGSASS